MPVVGECVELDALDFDILRDLGGHGNEACREDLGVKVDQDLKDRQGESFRHVDDETSRKRPPTSIEICPFAAKRLGSKALVAETPNEH